LAAEVSDWSRDWWIHHLSAEVDVQSNLLHDDDEDAMPWVSKNESGSIAIHLGSREIDAVGHHLAGIVDGEGEVWAQRIGRDALEDLALRIYKRTGVTKPVKLSRMSASAGLSQMQFGAYTVTIGLGTLAFHVAVDRHLVDRLVPPHVARGTNLILRNEALGSVPMRVNAVLNFGGVNLSHLSDLRVGEVVVGDRRLDETLQINVEGRGSIATGYLRRSGTQRAVMLDGANSQDRHTP